MVGASVAGFAAKVMAAMLCGACQITERERQTKTMIRSQVLSLSFP